MQLFFRGLGFVQEQVSRSWEGRSLALGVGESEAGVSLEEQGPGMALVGTAHSQQTGVMFVPSF